MTDIGLTNDSFVMNMLRSPLYTQRAASLGDLVSQFPDAKHKTLLGALTGENTIQAYLLGLGRLWFKEQIIGDFERGLSTEGENCSHYATQVALRMDHAEQSLKGGDLSESVRLTQDVVNSAPTSASRQSHTPELEQWLRSAKGRLTKEQNV